MGKSEKGKKNFWLFLAILLFALVLLILGFVGILYMYPNRPMLGLVYAKYTDAKAYTYDENTDISTLDITSIEVHTERSNINILPLDNGVYPLSTGSSGYTYEDNVIVVHQVRRFEGFSLANVGSPTYTASLNSGNLKITTTEPYNFDINSETYVNVYVPKDFSLTSIKAISTYGAVSLATITDTSSFAVSSVNLQTLASSAINMGRINGIQNMYFRTNKGDVNFSDTHISANSITFQSTSGTFNLYNNAITGIVEVADKLYLRADGASAGAKINIVKGNVEISGDSGNFLFSQIGTESTPASLIATTDNSYIFVNALYGNASIMEQTSSYSNVVHIKQLVSSNPSTIHVGSGSLLIENTSSDIYAESSSGPIEIKNVETDKNVYAYSQSGSIYVEYKTTNSMSEDTQTTIITDSGNIDLKNISSCLSVEVREDSSYGTLNIMFNAIARKDGKTNTIKAGSRRVQFTWSGNSSDLKCKLFATTSSITSTIPIMSLVESADADYELGTYTDYYVQYRIGYNKGNTVSSASAGRLFITNASSIAVATN